MDIIEATFKDKRIFASYINDSGTYGNWRVFLKSYYGLPLKEKEFKSFKKFTERKKRPKKKFEMVVCESGRKSGKTIMQAIIACYEALLSDFWVRHIKPGQKAYYPLIAVDKQQAKECFNYVNGLLHSSSLLKRQVLKERQWDIELKNGAVIMIRTSSFRAIRGPYYIGGGIDEAAFLRDETSANPAGELVKALLPGLIPGGTIFLISSVYNRSGFFYEMHKKYFSVDDPNVLIWRSSTPDMNPLYDKRKIDRALKEDYAHGMAEYYCHFRDDISSYLPSESVEACVVTGRRELPKAENIKYFGFCDHSGGRQDSAVLALSHRTKNGTVVIDVLRERVPPFKPESVSEEFSNILKDWGIGQIESDRYAGEWVTDSFEKHGIKVKPCEKSASELYMELGPAINQGSIELLDNKRLIAQLIGLERRTRSGGKDLITHYPGAHDDIANAVAGAYWMAKKKEKKAGAGVSDIGVDDVWNDPDPGPSWGSAENFKSVVDSFGKRRGEE